MSRVCKGLLSVLLASSIAQSASAQALEGYTSESNQIQKIDRQILAKEVELIKLNAEFRTHYTKGSKWKKRRMHLYDTAGGAIANAGDIALMSQFYRYYRHPGDGLAHKGRLEAGPIVVMVAYLTLGGLYAAEGVADLVGDYRGRRQGFDAKTISKRAIALKIDIDKLLDSRAQLMNEYCTDNKVLCAAEGDVLRDIRDVSLFEFSRLYVDSRKQRAARDLTTLGTIAVCATGAVGAGMVTNGVHNVNLKQVGGGGIPFLISGSTLTVAPALIHGGAAITGKVSAAKLEKSLGQGQKQSIETLAADLRKLEDAEKQVTAGGRSREYNSFLALLKERTDYLNRCDKDRKRQIIEDFISYGLKGGPQIAFGATLTHAGYKYSTNPVKAFRGVAHAATVNEVSWGSWMLDTFQRSARDEVRNYKDRKAGIEQAPFGVGNAKLVELEKSIGHK